MQTPGTVSNSWSTPSMLIEVMAHLMKPEVHDSEFQVLYHGALLVSDKRAVIFVFINFVMFGFQTQSFAILPLKQLYNC